MCDAEQIEHAVCPLWNAQDHRFAARHYAAWRRKCHICGRDVTFSRQQKKQADAEKFGFICEQCDLIEREKQQGSV